MKFLLKLFLITLPLLTNISCKKIEIKRRGCQSDPILIHTDSYDVYVPNVFTPNGDGKNDIWMAGVSTNYSTYSLEVYDGKKTIFNTNTPQNQWDGTHNGTNVKQGVYNYHIKVTFEEIEFDFMRSVTLIRDVGEFRINNCENCYPTAMEIICKNL